MFKDYLAQKQEKQAELEREKAVKKALEIIIPITLMGMSKGSLFI